MQMQLTRKVASPACTAPGTLTLPSPVAMRAPPCSLLPMAGVVAASSDHIRSDRCCALPVSFLQVYDARALRVIVDDEGGR